MLLLLHHHQEHALRDVPEVGLVELDLVQEEGEAAARDGTDVRAVLYEGEQAIQALISCRQVVVLDHLLNNGPIELEWVVRIAVHLVLFLECPTRSLIINEQLIDLLEGIQSHLPLWVEGLILEADVLELFVCLSPVGAFGVFVALAGAGLAVLALVVDVPDLVAVCLVQLMDGNVVELRHKGLPLLDLAVAVRLGEVGHRLLRHLSHSSLLLVVVVGVVSWGLAVHLWLSGLRARQMLLSILLLRV